MTVQGLDYYAGNGSVDLDGMAFALHKATEGTHTTDSSYATEILRIRAKVPVPGGYHFGWVTEDPVVQARFFWDTAGLKPGELAALELERYPDGRNFGSATMAEIDHWQQQFIAQVQSLAKGHNRVGLYCDEDLWSRLPSGKYGDFLWIAQYGVISPTAKGWELWQNSANGVDHDVALFDSPEAMKAWATFQEDDDMTPEQAAQLADLHAAIPTLGRSVWSYSHVGKAGDPDSPDVHQELHDGTNAAKAADAGITALAAKVDAMESTLAGIAAAVAKLTPAAA